MPIEGPAQSSLGAFIESSLRARDKGMEVADCRSPVKLLGESNGSVRFWRNRGAGRGYLTTNLGGPGATRVDFLAWHDRRVFALTESDVPKFYNGFAWVPVLAEGVGKDAHALREINGELFVAFQEAGNESRIGQWNGVDCDYVEPLPSGRGQIANFIDSGSAGNPGFILFSESNGRGGWASGVGTIYTNQDKDIAVGNALNQGYLSAPPPADAIGPVVESTSQPGFFFHRFGSTNGRTVFPFIITQLEAWQGVLAMGCQYENGADYQDDVKFRVLSWSGASFTVELDDLASMVNAVMPMEDWLCLSEDRVFAKNCSVQDGVVTAGPGTGAGTNTYSITVDGSPVSYEAAEGTGTASIAANLVTQANKLDVASFVGLHFERSGSTIRVASVSNTRVFTISLTVSGTGAGAVTNFAAAPDEIVTHDAVGNFAMWTLDSDLCEPELAQPLATQEIPLAQTWSYNVALASGEPPDTWRLAIDEDNSLERWFATVVSVDPTAGTQTWTVGVSSIIVSVPNETTASATAAALRAALALALTDQIVSGGGGGITITSNDTPDTAFECWIAVSGAGNYDYNQFERSVKLDGAVPSGMTIDASGAITWPSANKIAGSNPQLARVYGANAGGFSSLLIPVTVVSEAPIVETVPNETHDTDQGDYRREVGLTQARGPHEGTKTWTLVASPPNTFISSNVDDVSREYATVTSQHKVAGTYPITVRAENVSGFDEETWDLTITVSPPIIAPKADETFSISVDGFGFGYFATLTLSQGTATSANVIQGPAGMTATPGVGGLTIDVVWAVSSGATPGVYTIEIEAVNSEGSDTETWVLTLNP